MRNHHHSFYTLWVTQVIAFKPPLSRNLGAGTRRLSLGLVDPFTLLLTDSEELPVSRDGERKRIKIDLRDSKAGERGT